MQILQVNKFFFDKGGTERYFFSLSDALEKRGHQVIFFSMHHPNNKPSIYSDYFVSEVKYDEPLPFRKRVSRALSLIRSKEAETQIARLIDETSPDVAHFHNIYHQLTPSIIAPLRRAGVPIVMTLHDYKLVCPNYMLFDGKSYCFRCHNGHFINAPLTRCHDRSVFKSGLLALETQWQRLTKVYDAVDRFFAPSRFIRERYIEGGIDPNRIVYLPPYVPDTVASDEETRSGGVASHVIDLLPHKFVLFFGRLSVGKGLFTLMDAMKRLGDVPLVLCGDGPLRGELESYADAQSVENVYFTGHITKAELDPIIHRANMVVLPSESPENAPFTVLEAAAEGKPVVVSDVGGLPEMTERFGGEVFRTGNVEDLEKKISKIWKDDQYAHALGERGLQGLEDHYAQQPHIDRIEKVYKSLAK